MRPVVLQMGVTLDGYVAGQGDWGLPPEHPDVQAWKVASLQRVGTHVMGRVTYQEMASYWPNAAGQYADFMNTLPKVVFSATLPEAAWPQSRIARGDLAEEIKALKDQPGGEIIAWGGAGFVQALSRAGLIDQYAIVVQPVVYGGGKPMFQDLPDALHLRLMSTTTFHSGAMLNLYEPRGWGAAASG